MTLPTTIEKLTRFIGQDDPTCQKIVGKFHAHLTLNVSVDQLDLCRDFCRDQKVKLTIIDLENATGQQQTDVMTTSHYKDTQPGAVRRITDHLLNLAKAAEQHKFPVLRAKLEHESLPSFETFDEHRYHEVHIKLDMPRDSFNNDYQRLKQLGADHGFVPSRNPLQRGETSVTQFVNLRIYEGQHSDADVQVQTIEQSLDQAGYQRLETKRETVVFDTAQELDGWWA